MNQNKELPMSTIIIANVEKYVEGLEDTFLYFIPMFGLFDKEECLNAGFTPDFEKDKIPAIEIDNEWKTFASTDYILTFKNGKRAIWTEKDYLENILREGFLSP